MKSSQRAHHVKRRQPTQKASESNNERLAAKGDRRRGSSGGIRVSGYDESIELLVIDQRRARNTSRRLQLDQQHIHIG
jgi:hypothetical protein